MASYKEPSFAERTALARQARMDALKKLQHKAAPDAATIAERQAAAAQREAAEAAKREARRTQIAEEKAAKAAAKLAAEIAAMPEPAAPELTEEEKKAARDAKYAARKKRKG